MRFFDNVKTLNECRLELEVGNLKRQLARYSDLFDIDLLDDIRHGREFGLYGQKYRAVKVQSDSERLNGLESRIAKLENKVKK